MTTAVKVVSDIRKNRKS